MDNGGLVSATRLSDPTAALQWEDVSREWRSGGMWLHLDRTQPRVRDWLERESGIDPVVVDALLAEETRPRVAKFGDGVLVLLRGVNLNPGADPDDMVALRIWVDAERIVTIRARRLLAAQEVREEIQTRGKPTTVSEVLVRLIARLVARMAPVVDGLGEALDELEERSIEGVARVRRAEMSTLRRTAIGLRRYLAPQRDVLSNLISDAGAWLDDRARMQIRESLDALLRYVEELDVLRERSTVIGEEIAGLLAERMNRTMYVLSLVGTIFLPLGFVTGLLGVNVAGIPGADVPFAFAFLVVALVVVGFLELMLFRRWRLL